MYKINRQVTHDIIIPCVDNQYSFVRIFHSRPDMPPLDVYVNGVLRFRNIPYLGLSYYIPFIVSVNNIQVYQSGTQNLLLEVPQFQITGGQIFTFTIDRVMENLNILSIKDDITEKVYPDETKVRFVNLTGEEISVNLSYVKGGISEITERLPHANVSDYVKTTEGLYRIAVQTSKPGAYNPTARVSLPIGKLTTVYIVGSLDPTSKLFKEGGSAQVVIIVDGNTSFTICR